MPDVIFNGPDGRLEGRYQPGKTPTAPIGLVLHPHPQYGGTMNNKVVYYLYHAFARRGFATLRFNFRGVGRSQGEFDNGVGELSDAAAALDWLQSFNPNAASCWIAGFSFGAWISMQVLMRRPEIRGFLSIAPPANMYDFSFLAPCPSSGIIVNGSKDEIVSPDSVEKLVAKLKTQKAITIDHTVIEGAGHFFENELEQLVRVVDNYLTLRLNAEQ
ncbi:MAG: alpha/beta hydrolase [Sphingomonadales bacterium]|nr:alpha/beta hydrolase [Sphingomonadales bacterium]